MLKLNQTRGGKRVPILEGALWALPLVGLLFRGVSNTDIQSKLYIFVRAQIIRPADARTSAMKDLQRISDRDREAFEQTQRVPQAEFQQHQDVPAVRSRPTDPVKVLQTE